MQSRGVTGVSVEERGGIIKVKRYGSSTRSSAAAYYGKYVRFYTSALRDLHIYGMNRAAQHLHVHAKKEPTLELHNMY